jgi:hypothetical protein
LRFLPFLMLVAVGCQGGRVTSPTTPVTTPPAAAVSIAISPDPVVATDSSNPDAPLDARWTVEITSLAIGARVNFVNAILRDGASGAEAEPSGTLSLGPAEIAAAAGSNRVEPRGRLTVPESLEYGLPSGGRQGVLTVTVQLTEDDGSLTSKSARVAVN